MRLFIFMFFAFAQSFGVDVLADATMGSSWRPSRAVELVVPGGAGGGIDNTARLVQKLMRSERLVDQAITVLNKAGGGASVGFTYISRQIPDGASIALGSSALLTNHLTGKSTLNYTDITPVAQLFTEAISLMVREGSEIKDGKGMLEKMRAAPSSISIGVPSIASTNHITCALIAKALGQDPRRLRMVAFNSSNAGITALLGGHIDVVAAPLANAIPHVKRGTLRVVAISSSKRVAGILASAPTLVELGVPVVSSASRSVIGPKGMPREVIDFWDGVFSKLVSTDEWHAYLQENSWDDNYLDSAGSKEYFSKQYAELKLVLSDLGLVAK